VGAVAENWRLSTPSVVNLVRSKVCHTELPRSPSARDAARLAGLSATADPCSSTVARGKRLIPLVDRHSFPSVLHSLL